MGDMIDRDAVAKAVATLSQEFLDGGSPTAVKVLNLAMDRIRAIPVADARAENKPVAWMRRWFFDKNEGTKGKRPPGWHLHAVTALKALPDDVPLYTHEVNLQDALLEVAEMIDKRHRGSLPDHIKSEDGNAIRAMIEAKTHG